MEETATAKELFYRKLLTRSLWLLGVSGVLNIFAFAYIAIEFEEGDLPFMGSFAFTTAKHAGLPFESQQLLTLQGELFQTKGDSFDSLVTCLPDTTPLSDGYKRQDLALSLLVSRHHFNLAKALPGTSLQRRSVKIGPESLYLFPGISPEQYAAIQDFIQTESWPFTFQGLFLKLKEGHTDPSLQLACMQAREYQEIERFLIHDAKITKEQAFRLVLLSDFSLLSELREGALPEGRRGFLKKLLAVSPKEAACVLVETDFRYALHQLDDITALTVLKNLPVDSKLFKEYALGLLLSPRCDAVWKEVVLLLCTQAKLDPEKTSRSSLLAHYGVAKPKPVPAIPAGNLEEPQKGRNTIAQGAGALKGRPSPGSRAGIAEPVQKLEASKKPEVKALIAQAPKKPVVQQKPKNPPVVKRADIVHVVRAGDTLWALSKKYKIDVLVLKNYNGLKSDALQPGTQLRIPATTKK